MQALRDGVLRRSGIKNPTVRDFVRVSGRGRGTPPRTAAIPIR